LPPLATPSPSFLAARSFPHRHGRTANPFPASRYGVFGLKALAARKFATALAAGGHAAPEFPDACGDVYESTVDSDRGLRDLVIAAFRANPALNMRKDVEEMVRETPGLAWELYRVASGLPVYSN
jgi:hypothetical protein